MARYNVDGFFKIKIRDMEIEAASEEEALAEAKFILDDFYRLYIIGAHHNPKEDVELELDADLIEEK